MAIWASQVRWFLYESLRGLYLRVTDSKTLSSDTRASLLDTLSGDAANLGWSVRVLRLVDLCRYCQDITRWFGLHKQSQDATILLIREVLQRGIQLTEVVIFWFWVLDFYGADYDRTVGVR